MQIFLYFCSVKNRIYILLLLCCVCSYVGAENRFAYLENRNELRIGWGDQLFESLMWHNPTYIVTTMPESYERLYHENYHHDQHIWLEYQWRFTRWFGLGAMFDMSEVHWDDVTRNGKGAEINRSKGHYFYNLVIMPTVRFTYFHHENVNLYSGLGIGLGRETAVRRSWVLQSTSPSSVSAPTTNVGSGPLTSADSIRLRTPIPSSWPVHELLT